MTRIVAGFAGSQRLAVPPAGTRPTSDRVREAIFSALDSRDLLTGAAVLDLYAGSGALGFEAASRGAAEVTLVERNAQAAKIARGNAAIILKAAAARPERLPAPRLQVKTASVAVFLESTPATFDVVFLDPPYDVSEAELGDALRMLGRCLTDGAVVVVERSARSPEPVLPARLALDRRKDYGETTLWWLLAE